MQKWGGLRLLIDGCAVVQGGYVHKGFRFKEFGDSIGSRMWGVGTGFYVLMVGMDVRIEKGDI